MPHPTTSGSLQSRTLACGLPAEGGPAAGRREKITRKFNYLRLVARTDRLPVKNANEPTYSWCAWNNCMGIVLAVCIASGCRKAWSSPRVECWDLLTMPFGRFL